MVLAEVGNQRAVCARRRIELDKGCKGGWAMKRSVWAAFAASVLFLSAMVPSIEAYAASGSVAASMPASGGIVILLRGGLNIFSTGMDELAMKLRASGIDARSEPHADWPKLAAEARQRYVKTRKPFVLIGHSWGALAAILFAVELNKSGTPVDLMFLYDTTQSVKIPANVRHVINFSSSTAIGLGFTATGLSGFHGRIDNIDVPEFGHLDMDNAAPLHQQTIAEVLTLIRPGHVRWVDREGASQRHVRLAKYDPVRSPESGVPCLTKKTTVRAT